MDEGTYDVDLDGVPLISARAHGVTARGIGRIMVDGFLSNSRCAVLLRSPARHARRWRIPQRLRVNECPSADLARKGSSPRPAEDTRQRSRKQLDVECDRTAQADHGSIDTRCIERSAQDYAVRPQPFLPTMARIGRHQNLPRGAAAAAAVCGHYAPERSSGRPGHGSAAHQVEMEMVHGLAGGRPALVTMRKPASAMPALAGDPGANREQPAHGGRSASVSAAAETMCRRGTSSTWVGARGAISGNAIMSHRRGERGGSCPAAMRQKRQPGSNTDEPGLGVRRVRRGAARHPARPSRSAAPGPRSAGPAPGTPHHLRVTVDEDARCQQPTARPDRAASAGDSSTSRDAMRLASTRSNGPHRSP